MFNNCKTNSSKANKANNREAKTRKANNSRKVINNS